MAQPESKTSARRIASAARAKRAVELRLSRVSYARIAQELGLKDESSARKAVQRELGRLRRATTESAEELRQMDLAKLDDAELRMTMIIRGKGNDESAIKATRALVDLQARRSKLLGLDAPTKQEVTPGGGTSWADLVAAATGGMKEER